MRELRKAHEFEKRFLAYYPGGARVFYPNGTLRRRVLEALKESHLLKVPGGYVLEVWERPNPTRLRDFNRLQITALLLCLGWSRFRATDMPRGLIWYRLNDRTYRILKRLKRNLNFFAK